MDNSTFTLRVAGTLYGKDPIIASLKQEDASWSQEIEDNAHDAFLRASSEAHSGQPGASTSYGHLDGGKAKAVDMASAEGATKPVEQEPQVPEDEPKGGNEADDEEDQRSLLQSCSRLSEQSSSQ